MTKMVKQEDSEITSSHGYTIITTIHTATIYENNLKTNRKYLQQLKI